MVWSGKTRMGMDCGATQKTRVSDPPNQSVVTIKATAQIECTVRATARLYYHVYVGTGEAQLGRAPRQTMIVVLFRGIMTRFQTGDEP